MDARFTLIKQQCVLLRVALSLCYDVAGATKTERASQMTCTLLTAVFITLLSQTAWADEMPDMGQYSAIIKDSLDRNGADCHLETYSVKEKTNLTIIFSIKCSQSSYLKGIEVTCTQTPSEHCFVSGY